ncbi:MAG: hypothetical protein DWP95_07020 [Proteobacteria bacterium]|nr:MAG: hypothetical protein DWP95_07020 [Pseudomonadota bacterium]
MDINQNQKAVSPNLRLLLDEDLHWKSQIAAYRLKALKASIVRELSSSTKSVLYNKISIGEDSALLKFKPFITALGSCGLIPKARGNKYTEFTNSSLYDVNNHNHEKEMYKAKIRIVAFIQYCYEYVEENYRNIYEAEDFFILSNRGTFAFISIIGSLNSFVSRKYGLKNSSSSEERFKYIKKYIDALMRGINKLSEEEKKEKLSLLGAGADKKWFIFFMSLINEIHSEYEPKVLVDWKERQDKDLLNEGRIVGEEIEKFIKKTILNNLSILFGDNWELEISNIKQNCMVLAEKEKEKNYKEGLGKKEVRWTDMFTINDYKTIIEKFWTTKPEGAEIKTFEQIFAIDIGEKFNSKKEKTKWISLFNSYRNIWAHAGTKESGLNKNEVSLLKKIHSHLIK